MHDNPAAAIDAAMQGSGADTARALDEHPSAWQRWVSGKVSPRAARVAMWCRILGVTVQCTDRGWVCVVGEIRPSVLYGLPE